jgi:hypothetical protein
VIQKSQGPEEGKRKLVAVRAGVFSSPDYMKVELDLERTSDNNVERCCYPTTQTTTWTEEIIMEGGLEAEESETFTDSFNDSLDEIKLFMYVRIMSSMSAVWRL